MHLKVGKGAGPSALNGPPLKPLYSVINKALKNLENQTVLHTRNSVVKASEEIETIK